MCDDRKWTPYLFSNKKGLMRSLNPLSAKFTKWSNTLKQFVGNLPTSYLSVFDHFVGLQLTELKVEGDKSKVRVLNKLREEHDFSLRPVAQLIL